MLTDDMITTDMWEKSFQKKFSNFCSKSPVLLKMSIRIQDGSKGVLLNHVNSDRTYFFPFNYDQNVKDFIADIKRLLVNNHYPRVVQTLYENHKKTNSELAEELEKGGKVDELNQFCVKKVGERIYRIDKVLPWKNIAIIVLEKSNVPYDEIGSTLKYSYQKSLVLFLKNYRTNVFKSIDEASDDFFNNSLLVSEITSKKKEEEEK
jgi:hypothetical protein